MIRSAGEGVGVEAGQPPEPAGGTSCARPSRLGAAGQDDDADQGGAQQGDGDAEAICRNMTRLSRAKPPNTTMMRRAGAGRPRRRHRTCVPARPPGAGARRRSLPLRPGGTRHFRAGGSAARPTVPARQLSQARAKGTIKANSATPGQSGSATPKRTSPQTAARPAGSRRKPGSFRQALTPTKTELP